MIWLVDWFDWIIDLIDRLVGWLYGWMVGRLVDFCSIIIDQFTDRLIGMLGGSSIGQFDWWLIYQCIDRLIGWLVDRLIGILHIPQPTAGPPTVADPDPACCHVRNSMDRPKKTNYGNYHPYRAEKRSRNWYNALNQRRYGIPRKPGSTVKHQYRTTAPEISTPWVRRTQRIREKT